MRASEPEAPVFVAYYEMVGWILDRVEAFPKNRRFVFGQRLANHAIDVLELITAALYSRNRRQALTEANRKLQTVRVLIRLCRDRGLVNAKQYGYAATRLTEVGAMIGGWLNSERKG
jgi:hypothetical protein